MRGSNFYRISRFVTSEKMEMGLTQDIKVEMETPTKKEIKTIMTPHGMTSYQMTGQAVEVMNTKHGKCLDNFLFLLVTFELTQVTARMHTRTHARM